ncbi:MAG: SdiA-regulated domain-containing protein [Actinomycetota bacterium]
MRPLRRLGTLAATCLIGTVVMPEPASAGSYRATVVQQIDLARVSSDPAGVTWLPSSRRFLVVDCNLNELAGFAGDNLWELSRSGSVKRSGDTTGYTNEPTGVSFDPDGSRLFVSDDDRKRILVVRRGSDGRFGTSDDRISSFGTAAFGSGDPEDVAFDPHTGALFVVDGVGRAVFRLAPGADGSVGSGRVTRIDVARYGAGDPEGIAYDAGRRTIFVLDYRSRRVYELTTAGTLRNTIDVSAATGGQLAGLVIAPASSGHGNSLWIVDRGINNSQHRTARYDGKLFELSVPLRFGAS